MEFARFAFAPALADHYSPPQPELAAITRFTSFFNMTGHPATTFPCGMHSRGFPIAAQQIGQHYEDEFLPGLAETIEQEFALGVPLPTID